MKISLTEGQLRQVVKRCVAEALNEEYNKWFQTEQNDAEAVKELIRKCQGDFANLDALTPEEVWEDVRMLGYINHSAYKVRPGMWDKYPDEMLNDTDENLNQLVYSFKCWALKKLVAYYLDHGLDVSKNEKGDLILFREPTTGIRQITFHVGHEFELAEPIKSHDDIFAGVTQAHHYDNDTDFKNMQKKSIWREGDKMRDANNSKYDIPQEESYADGQLAFDAMEDPDGYAGNGWRR